MGEEEKYTITKSPAFWIFVEEVQMSTDGLQVNNVYTVHQMYVLHDMALFTVYIYIQYLCEPDETCTCNYRTCTFCSHTGVLSKF